MGFYMILRDYKSNINIDFVWLLSYENIFDPYLVNIKKIATLYKISWTKVMISNISQTIISLPNE